MILLLDNYDSFTYNIAHYLQDEGATVEVVRNDVLTIGEVLAKHPAGIMISPGPGMPEGAGISVALIKSAPMDLPIFGVCLGMQALAVAFGARIGPARSVMHGKISDIRHHDGPMFANIPSPFAAVRYHSLAVSRTDLPANLRIEAETGDREIMALTHTARPVMGVQFHPESIGSDQGKTLLRTFVALTETGRVP